MGARVRRDRVVTVEPMVSAWVLVTLAFLVALACAYGAYRVGRRPKGARR